MAKEGVNKFLRMIGLDREPVVDLPEGETEEVMPRKRRTAVEEPIQLQQHRVNDKVMAHPEISHKVVMFQPGNVEQTTLAINDLLDGRSLIVNLEEIDSEVAQRIIDTLSGAIYAVNGTLKRIARQTYMLTPSFVEVLDRTETTPFRSRSPFSSLNKRTE